MKKLSKGAGESPKPSKLYLDDLEEMFEVFSSTGQNAKILAAGFEMESIDELASLPDRTLHELEMRCFDPYVSMDFRPTTTWLWRGDDSNTSRGAVERIRTIIARRRRRFSWIEGPAFSGVSGGLAVTLLGEGAFLLITLHPAGIAAVVAGAVLVMPSIRFFRGRNSHTTIVLSRRVEAPGFWARNNDRLIVAGITIVLTAVVTWAITRLGS